MTDRWMDEVLGLLDERVTPDQAFQTRLDERVTAELRGAREVDDQGDRPEVMVMEANVRALPATSNRRWVAAAAVIALAAAASVTAVVTRDDDGVTTTADAAGSYEDADLLTIEVGGASNPYFVAVEADVWVLSLSGELTRIDAETGKVSGRFTVPDSSPLAADDNGVWIADAIQGDVVRLDARSGDVIARVETGVELATSTVRVPMREDSSARPFSSIGGIAADGEMVWVGDRAGRVLRIDPAVNEVVESFPVDVRPDVIAVEGDALLVANLRAGDVEVIDRTTGAEVHEVTGAGRLAGAALYGSALYLQDETTGVVTRIDLHSGDRLTSDALGASPAAIGLPTLPTGLVVGARGVLVATSGSSSVHVLDPDSLRELDVLAIPEGRGDMTIAPDGSAWIVRTRQHTVVRITTAD